MRRFGCLAALAVLGCGLAGPAAAQSYEFTMMSKACQNYGAPDVKQRIAFCTDALERSANEAWVVDADRSVLVLFRAEAWLLLKNYDAAIRDADLAATYSARDPQVQNMRCWSRAVADQELDVAAAACDMAMQLKPGDFQPRDSRAFVAMRQGKWQEAYDHYRKAASFRRATQSKYGLGLAAIALGKTKDGERSIREALSADPHAGDELNALGFTPEAMKAKAG